MGTLRLAIFGINYWPEPVGTALNTTGLAAGLVRRGWDVVVVTGVPHYPYWRPEPAPARETRDGVRILRYPHFVAVPRTTPHRGAYEATWAMSALRALPSLGPRDVILGVSPSVGGLALARAAGLVHRRPYCVLIQDLVGRAAAQSGMPGTRAVAGPVAAVERWLAKDAAAVMIVAEGFRDHFSGLGRPIVRVRNPARLGPATADRAATRAALGWATETVVLHTGSIGFKQGLETVLDAAQLADERIRFVLQGDGNQRAVLEHGVRARGLTNVEFRELDPPEVLPNTLAAADVLLLHQRAGVRNSSMPAKLGTYFAAGRPVVAAVERDDEVAREIESAGAGVLVLPGDPRALLDAIGSLRDDPGRAALLGQNGRAFAARELSAEISVDAIGSTLADAARKVGSGP